VRVGYEDFVRTGAVATAHGDRHRAREAAVAAAQLADRERESRAGVGERIAAHLVAARVRHVEDVVPGDERRAAVRQRNRVGLAQSVHRVERLELHAVELAHGSKYQHAVVVGVGDEHAPAPVAREAVRARQTPEGALRAVERHQTAAHLAHQQAVPGRVGNDLKVTRFDVRETVVDVHVSHHDGRVRVAEQVLPELLVGHVPGQHVHPGLGEVGRLMEGFGGGTRRAKNQDGDDRQ
jgi:hypothetical protein